MPDIYHTFVINASTEKVFEAINTSRGLDNWWTKSSDVNPGTGGTCSLYFGPGYNWKALVTKYKAGKEFELQITDAHEDWLGTRVGFILNNIDGNCTEVSFYHTGWPENNHHYRVSCYCWAMYLRILKRYIEFDEQVPYEDRLNV